MQTKSSQSTDVTLYHYQGEAVQEMSDKDSFLLADDMGLGKTVTVLVEIRQNPHERVLIVCPKTVIPVWEAHIKWLVPEAVVHNGVYLGMQFGSPCFVVTNYEQVRINEDLYRQVHWDYLVADEAHYLKNRKARRTRALKHIRATRKRALTGTPVINRPDELWSLLNWLHPLRYRSYWKFFEFYCNPPEAPILMADYTFKELGKVQVGDLVMGWDQVHDYVKLVPSEVLATHTREAPLVQVLLESGTSLRCTPDHLWEAGHLHRGYWTTPQVGKSLAHIVDPPRVLSPEEQRVADWLSGVYDGEGTWPFISQSRVKNPEVYERICRSLEGLGFNIVRQDTGVRVRGGPEPYKSRGDKSFRQATVNFLNWCEPSKKDWIYKRLTWKRMRTPDKIISVVPDGEGEVISMMTSTGNYIVHGYASKNCDYWQHPTMGYKKVLGPKNTGHLRAELSQFTLRRLKQEVLTELPEKYYTRVLVDLHPPQRRAYEGMKKDFLAWIGQHENEPVPAPVVVAQLTRLRQFAAAYAQYDEDGRVRLTEPSAKLDALMEIVEGTDQQIVVFSQFKDAIRLAQARLKDAGISYTTLTGDTPQGQRGERVESFQAGQRRVFLGTTGAGGVGITLHAASIVVFIDRSWSPADNAQAEDRLHRIGQKSAVQVILLEARDTVDQAVEAKLRMKWSWIKQILGKDG